MTIKYAISPPLRWYAAPMPTPTLFLPPAIEITLFDWCRHAQISCAARYATPPFMPLLCRHHDDGYFPYTILFCLYWFQYHYHVSHYYYYFHYFSLISLVIDDAFDFRYFDAATDIPRYRLNDLPSPVIHYADIAIVAFTITFAFHSSLFTVGRHMIPHASATSFSFTTFSGEGAIALLFRQYHHQTSLQNRVYYQFISQISSFSLHWLSMVTPLFFISLDFSSMPQPEIHFMVWLSGLVIIHLLSVFIFSPPRSSSSLSPLH